MATYGAITFLEQTQGGQHPHPTRAVVKASEHVPSASFDVTQYMGRGNWHLVVVARFTLEADRAAMEVLAGDGVARSLTVFGVTYPSVYLSDVRNPVGLNVGGHNTMELEFEW